MPKTLDLSNVFASHPLSIDNEDPKQTPTGLPFATYRGLRQYWITGKINSRWLHVTDPTEIQKLHQLKEMYIHVPNLAEKLEEVLLTNVSRNGMLKALLGKKTEIVWTRDNPSPVDVEWLAIVKRAVSKL
jgi:hypothetical protein